MDNAVLYSLTYGMYVVGAAAEDKVNAQIANTCFQITSDPKILAVSINKDNYTHSLISQGGFSLSIISTQCGRCGQLRLSHRQGVRQVCQIRLSALA